VARARATLTNRPGRNPPPRSNRSLHLSGLGSAQINGGKREAEDLLTAPGAPFARDGLGQRLAANARE
jgi:hypothetical protein